MRGDEGRDGRDHRRGDDPRGELRRRATGNLRRDSPTVSPTVSHPALVLRVRIVALCVRRLTLGTLGTPTLVIPIELGTPVELGAPVELVAAPVPPRRVQRHRRQPPRRLGRIVVSVRASQQPQRPRRVANRVAVVILQLAPFVPPAVPVEKREQVSLDAASDG